jgi:hypothetical protein
MVRGMRRGVWGTRKRNWGWGRETVSDVVAAARLKLCDGPYVVLLKRAWQHESAMVLPWNSAGFCKSIR